MTDTGWPATVRAPVRAAVPLAAATLKEKVPGPVAEVPPVAEIHAASERAVQLHWLAVETAIDPAPPAAPIVTEVAERLKVQEAGVGLVGSESQPESATPHTTSSVPSRMAASLTSIRALAGDNAWRKGRLRAGRYAFVAIVRRRRGRLLELLHLRLERLHLLDPPPSAYLTPSNLTSVSNRRKFVYVASPVIVRDSVS